MHHSKSSTGESDKTLPNLPPGDISDLAHLLRSPPPVPSSPAPAYTALPFRDVDFHLAPLMDGRPGDIELETTNGKRFLVHRKVLEQETVFFHIYYGFIPVWRLATPHIGPPHPNLPSGPPPPHSSVTSTATGAINNLLCLPKLIASHLRCPPVYDRASHDQESTPGPPVPLKEVTAPTPTNNPYTWCVPEHSRILASFLSLIYPKGTFSTRLEETLPDLETTSRVIRASMGYQSSKALSISRDRLYDFIDQQPLRVYALGCFFKFNDISRKASLNSIDCSIEQIQEERHLMGRGGYERLIEFKNDRSDGLRKILTQPLLTDGHSSSCVRKGMIEKVWREKVDQLINLLSPSSDLIQLLEIDLRGGHCGDCLVLLGQTIQKCLIEAKGLPCSV